MQFQDPVADAASAILRSTGIPHFMVMPYLTGASLGLPVSSKVLPWKGTCMGIAPTNKFCLPVNGMLP